MSAALCQSEKPKLKFVALLRGINVGGKNIISKEELHELFEDLGYQGVRTYIQSGNILFKSDEENLKKLTSRIEDELSKRFSYPARAVVLSENQYESALAAAPKSWGKDDQQKHNALFLLNESTPEEVSLKLPAPKPAIELIEPREKVVFWSVSKEALTKTSYMKLAKLPFYQEVTIRNHNTVFKLQQLFNEI